MPAWSVGDVLAAVVLVGTPLVTVVRGATRLVRDRRAARRLQRAALEREALRRAAPGTVVVEGRVVAPGAPDELRIVTRRQFGCLGGPVVHVVPAFELERDDGTRTRVEPGDDPVVENLALLFEQTPPRPPRPDVSPPFPPPTGGPLSVALLRGRVRVAGVVGVDGGRVVPPPGASAVLTILGPQS